MIKLVAVNVKKLELLKDVYVATMVAHLLPVTRKPEKEIEEHYTAHIKRVAGRKWELRNQHFREIHPESGEGSIGFVWFRTSKQGLFSDVAFLQWINIDTGHDRKEVIDAVLEILQRELRDMGVKRLTTEFFEGDRDLEEILAKHDFTEVRRVVHKRLDD